MKKIFIKPEAEVIEFVPSENVMWGIFALSAENAPTSKIQTSDKHEYINSEHEMWKGFKK